MVNTLVKYKDVFCIHVTIRLLIMDLILNDLFLLYNDGYVLTEKLSGSKITLFEGQSNVLWGSSFPWHLDLVLLLLPLFYLKNDICSKKNDTFQPYSKNIDVDLRSKYELNLKFGWLLVTTLLFTIWSHLVPLGNSKMSPHIVPGDSADEVPSLGSNSYPHYPLSFHENVKDSY